MQLIARGRLGAHEIADEVVPAAAHHVWLVAEPVGAIGEQEQVKVFVGFDQLIDYQKRVIGRHIVVHSAVGEQQMSFEVFGNVLVGLIVIVGGAIGLALQESLV